MSTVKVSPPLFEANLFYKDFLLRQAELKFEKLFPVGPWRPVEFWRFSKGLRCSGCLRRRWAGLAVKFYNTLANIGTRELYVLVPLCRRCRRVQKNEFWPKPVVTYNFPIEEKK